LKKNSEKMTSKTYILPVLLFCFLVVSAQFIEFESTIGMQHADIVTVDVDNDGDFDVVASGEITENGVNVAKSVTFSNNNGVFEQQISTKTSYQNPIFEPDFADPTVIRAADGWFYAYSTENTWTDGVHHVVPIIKSKNLTQWQFVADAFATRPTWKSDGGIWAPDVSFVNGKYYMFYSISTWGDKNPGIGLAIATQPDRNFIDQGKIFDSQSIGVANSIDPFLFQTGVGAQLKSYLFWGSFNGIYGIEMAADLKSTTGTKFKIAGNAFEAPYIYEKDGKFYFFGSIGSCCDGANSQYKVGTAIATNIKGPYLDKSGLAILNDGRLGTPFLKGDKALGWVGPGHNSKIVTDDAGSDFFLYHAVDVSKSLLPGGATRRPLMMDKLNWVNGWPEITGGMPSNSPQITPQISL